MSVTTTHQPWKRRMANEYIDDEDDHEEEPRRPIGPRFGPFVTIAVAILLLFGVASRIGKPAESGNWLSLDLLASKSLSKERQRLLEQRNTTLVTLGAMPVPAEGLRRTSGSFSSESQVLSPPRGDVDYQQYQESRRPTAVPLSLPLPTPLEGGGIGTERYDGVSGGPDYDPAPEAGVRRETAAGGSTSTYVVANGDNWVKIGKATGKKWQDLQKANPQAAEGLRVGMRLTIP